MVLGVSADPVPPVPRTKEVEAVTKSRLRVAKESVERLSDQRVPAGLELAPQAAVTEEMPPADKAGVEADAAKVAVETAPAKAVATHVRPNALTRICCVVFCVRPVKAAEVPKVTLETLRLVKKSVESWTS